MNNAPDITRDLGKCRERLTRLCINLCRNRADAEDLFQETCFRAFRYYRKYDPKRDFENWIVKICVNTYRTELRKKYIFRMKQFETEEEHDLFFNLLPDRESESEEYRSLTEAVKKLPEKYRVVVALRYFNDYSEESTAQMLGIPVGTVKSRLHKAKKLIREVMENE